MIQFDDCSQQRYILFKNNSFMSLNIEMIPCWNALQLMLFQKKHIHIDIVIFSNFIKVAQVLDNFINHTQIAVDSPLCNSDKQFL